MRLSDVERTRLIEILASNVSADKFLEVVREHDVVPDFERLRKRAPEDPTEARRFIATEVVEAYDQKECVWQLARSLFRLSYRDDQLGPLLAEFASPPHTDAEDGWQGAMVKRANTMASRELRVFLEENEGKVCLIVATCDHPNDGLPPTWLGTGFLVGPDVVLTAYHTLRRHIAKGKAVTPNPGKCYALFDYYEGQRLTNPDKIPDGAIPVPFAEDWLIDSKESMDKDGLFVTPSVAQLALLPERLDFALVRLAKPVGLQTRSPSGGRRRSWIKLPAEAMTLRDDDRIIIPQHPKGDPQQIDFGRYSEPDSALDPTQTRLRYTTETDNGTSGAPCFNQGFRLVGMHNAAFKPDKIEVRKNQAIRIDRILSVLTNIPGSENEREAARLWNTSISPEPRVILGREPLLNWLDSAAVEKPASRSQRIYAAFVDPKDVLANSGFGKTYTIDIVRAARRGSSEPIVVLGNEDNVLPDNVSDFIRALALQFGISSTIIDTMPQRPASELPSASPNPDKLRRWASEDVPGWFEGVLHEFRVVDQALEAKRRIETLTANHVAPSPTDLSLAEQPVGKLGERWARAWIVITGLWKSRLTEEVRDLVAGLIGGRLFEDAVPQELRRIRWLFIGYVPDFLGADQVTRELLEPRGIGTPNLVAGFRSLEDSLAVETSFTDQDLAALINWSVMYQPHNREDIEDPTTRLRFLQGLFPSFGKAFLGPKGSING